IFILKSHKTLVQMRSLFTIALLIFVSTSVFSQNSDQAWRYAESITEQQLEHTLTIIASDQMQGRETGTEGQRRAAIYISGEFRKMGLKEPAGLENYQQKYLLYRDSLATQSAFF